MSNYRNQSGSNCKFILPYFSCLKPGYIDETGKTKMTLDQETNIVISVQILTCMMDVLIVQMKIQV